MLDRAVAALLLLVAVGGAHAQDAPNCDTFKWSVARERAWFAATPTPVAAGARLPAMDRGYLVSLVPDEAAGFASSPERAPKPGAYGGVFEIAEAGTYEVTLSGEAWVDVVQAGARVKSVAFSGRKDCPDVRKSVKFDLAAGPATLQISNSDSDRLRLAAAPAE